MLCPVQDNLDLFWAPWYHLTINLRCPWLILMLACFILLLDQILFSPNLSQVGVSWNLTWPWPLMTLIMFILYSVISRFTLLSLSLTGASLYMNRPWPQMTLTNLILDIHFILPHIKVYSHHVWAPIGVSWNFFWPWPWMTLAHIVLKVHFIFPSLPGLLLSLNLIGASLYMTWPWPQMTLTNLVLDVHFILPSHQGLFSPSLGPIRWRWNLTWSWSSYVQLDLLRPQMTLTNLILISISYFS